MRKSYVLAFVFAVAAAGWVASGQLGADGEPEETDAAEATAGGADEPAGVRVARSVATARSRDLVLRGRTEASRWVDVKAETRGRIIEVVAREGARVGRGDAIVRLAMEDRVERLAGAEARVRQRRIEFDAARSLRRKGFRAETKLAEAAAELEAAIAHVARISIDIDRTEIGAPFAGVVETRGVELGDFVESGDVIARIVDEDPYLVVGQVSELDVGLLEEGAAGAARLAGGETVKGKVRYIGSVAETATRTFRVEFEVPNRAGALRAGVTAEIRIPVESVQAHFLSPALLTLDDEGALGVRIVNDDAVVEFMPVSVFAAETDGVWVTGLPPTATVITVGQEFVRHGQPVRPIPEQDERAS